MEKRTWIIFGVVVVAVLGALIWFTRSNSGDSDVDISGLDIWKVQTAETLPEGQIADHVTGKTDSKVMMIEYEDYACIHCAQLAPTLKQIQTDYADKVEFVYRNFSLDYPNSIATESAAEAAGLQGKYWEMHDKLFADTSTWTGQAVLDRMATFKQYAGELGLDVDKFESDMSNTDKNGISDKLMRDKLMGKKVGVNGTPSIFINKQRIDTPTDSAIRAAIDTALKE